MKIAICHTKIGNDANAVYQGLEAGAKRHGDTPIHCYSAQGFRDSRADVAIMISYPHFSRPDRLIEEYDFLQKEDVSHRIDSSPINIFRREVLSFCNNNSIRPIFIDSGIIKCSRERKGSKDNYYQVGYDCIKGLGIYYNDNMPDDRFKKLNIELAPWRELNKNCLMFGQLPFGIGTQHIDIRAWYRHCLLFFKNNRVSVFYCEHPNVEHAFTHEKYKIRHIAYQDRTDPKLGFALAFSSNAIVDAIINGIPPIAMSRLSPAYKVCTNDVRDYNIVKTFDRERWLSDMAYTQWNVHEMESGECWNHLRPYAKMSPSALYPFTPKITSSLTNKSQE